MFLTKFILHYWWVWVVATILLVFVNKTVFSEFVPLPWQLAKTTEPVKTLVFYLAFFGMIASLTLWIMAALINVGGKAP